jgi:hypothetical protein
VKYDALKSLADCIRAALRHYAMPFIFAIRGRFWQRAKDSAVVTRQKSEPLPTSRVRRSAGDRQLGCHHQRDAIARCAAAVCRRAWCVGSAQVAEEAEGSLIQFIVHPTKPRQLSRGLFVELWRCPLLAVDSTGRRNTLSHSFCWGLNAKVLHTLPAIPKSPVSLPQ